MNLDISKLEELRKENKKSLQDLAEALGFKTAGGYKRIETGENKLKAEHLPILAEEFGMSLNEFINLIFFNQ